MTMLSPIPIHTAEVGVYLLLSADGTTSRRTLCKAHFQAALAAGAEHIEDYPSPLPCEDCTHTAHRCTNHGQDATFVDGYQVKGLASGGLSCNCKAHRFRQAGTMQLNGVELAACPHLHHVVAASIVCTWHSAYSAVQQSPEQRAAGICPLCGSPTAATAVPEPTGA